MDVALVVEEYTATFEVPPRSNAQSTPGPVRMLSDSQLPPVVPGL